MSTQTTLKVIRNSYSKVGPTSVSDSSIAMKKKIQNRVLNGPGNANPLKGATVLWGLKSTFRQPNRGDGAQTIKFAGIFPRMRF